MFGRGLRLTLILNSFRAGSLVSAMRDVRITSCTILRNVLRVVCN